MTYKCVRVPRCHDFTSFDLNKKITLGCTLGYCVEQESCDCVLALIIKYMNTHTQTQTLSLPLPSSAMQEGCVSCG